MLPKKKSRANQTCPKVNQTLGLLRKTPSDNHTVKILDQIKTIEDLMKWRGRRETFKRKRGKVKNLSNVNN